MGLFGFFKKEVHPEDIDYLSNAQELETKGDFPHAILEYQKAIEVIFSGKPPRAYRHITKKIISCYQSLGDYDKVFEMWPQQYDASEYGAKEMFELIKLLEVAQKPELIMKVYDKAGNKLIRNKIEFLMRQKKIPEANDLMNHLLPNINASMPGARDIWLTKARLCLSLRKWEEANKYLNKILELSPHDEEVRKLKEFCFKQVRNS